MSLSDRIAIEALDGAGCGLRVVFIRQGDLFEHTIAAVQAGVESPLLYCVQLPLQEIVDHRTSENGQALLATGAGDGRYWSISITPLTDVRLASLEFDVACRDSLEWPPPSVDYRLAAGLSQQGETLSLVDGRRFTVGDRYMPTSVATELTPTCELESSPRQIAFRSLRAPHVSTPKMTRWRYGFTFVRQD